MIDDKCLRTYPQKTNMDPTCFKIAIVLLYNKHILDHFL